MADHDKLILGTRGSALALWQAHHIQSRLQSGGVHVDLKVIQTEGDLQQSTPLSGSDVGVFVRRIEHSLLSGEIDFAVHSMKDLPTTQPEGLVIAAVPLRHDPRDAVLTVGGLELLDLPQGAVVGTCSPRRKMQLLRARPDLRIMPLRGNVDTRVARLRSGAFDAIVLALAGVERLEIDTVEIRPIPVDTCLPAVGQGALAIETRTDDAATRSSLAVLNHAQTAMEVGAERVCLKRLGGGCLAPATAYARLSGDDLELSAAVGEIDGTRLLLEAETAAATEAEPLAERVAGRLLAAGAGELLARARQVS